MRLKFFTKKKSLFFVLLFLLVTLSCIPNPEIINQDTGTDIDIGSAPYELLGEKYSNISREIIKKYGSPQTLSDTNNERLVAYFPKGDFTIITDARTTTINAVLSGRVDDIKRILQY
jgi:hypothetical protein